MVADEVGLVILAFLIGGGAIFLLLIRVVYKLLRRGKKDGGLRSKDLRIVDLFDQQFVLVVLCLCLLLYLMAVK